VADDRVDFSYGDQRVLDDVSFELRRHQITAVVGPSGGGKSTLLALLCRFYEPTTGTPLIDGRPYHDQTLAEVRGRIALVEQDNPVLHGSLRDNVMMGRPTASDAEIWTVLEQVNLADTIKELSRGLDANVLDRGRALNREENTMNISGGQRQRLAIARALLSPAELILLDEPTAHLDRDNENTVMSTLMAQRGERTVLVVAHRLCRSRLIRCSHSSRSADR
jgi:ABC-type multidrug transport system fused ATPase/permease subunit